MSLTERLFPFTAAPTKSKELVATPAGASIIKALTTKVMGLDFNGMYSSMAFVGKDRSNFEEAPYDLNRIIEAIDTDSYVKQAFNKYRELFWKEGWEIVSENDEAVDYLWQRLDLFAEFMKQPFTEFLSEAVDQLIKFDNVFIAKARSDIRPVFPGKLYPLPDKETICGYYIIPTETVKILRDEHNKPLKYRQSLSHRNGTFYGPQTQEPTWDADEVIHLHMFKKPGRAFGTPMIVGVLDDVVALRQIEEDIQNLIHRDLFPLYKYIVGTDDKPSTPEEITQAAEEIANIRVEGGIILPERHDVDVIGGKNSALDAAPYLKEFKHRVAIGLGVYPHHLGMSEGGNRAATDRLDIAVYDKVKMFQRFVEGRVQFHIFNELLREGGFDPSVTPLAKGDSDRCIMRFKEIDIDTQIKKETNLLNQFAQNAIEFDELRIALGRRGEVDPNQLLMSMTAQVQTAAQIHVLQAQALLTPVAPPTETKTTKSSTGASTTTTKTPQASPPKELPPAAKKPDGVTPSVGGAPNQKNDKRSKNAVRPANQHGRRNSPNVRHMDDAVLNDIIELLEKDESYNE